MDVMELGDHLESIDRRVALALSNNLMA